MKTCSYCGKGYPDDALVCDVEQTPLGSGILESTRSAGSSPTAKPAIACPACGALDDYKPAVDLCGSFNLLVFLSGGLLGVLFYNAGRPRRVQCNKCGALFNLRTPLSRFSRVIFWLLVAPTVVSIIILLLLLLYTFFVH